MSTKETEEMKFGPADPQAIAEAETEVAKAELALTIARHNLLLAKLGSDRRCVAEFVPLTANDVPQRASAHPRSDPLGNDRTANRT
jgi:hypothetical protein